MYDMQKKVLGHSYMDWAWVVGGGVLAGMLGKMIGIKGVGLSVMGSITGYSLRGWKNGVGVKAKIIDLRQQAMLAAQGAIPITGASSDTFIVPDPNLAPAPGSEGALAGYGMPLVGGQMGGYGRFHDPIQDGGYVSPNIVQHGNVTREVWQPGVVNQTPLRTR